MPSNFAATRTYLFGNFRFHPARQLLMEGELAIRLGSRAVDILEALVERPGSLLTKQELIGRAWPTTVVEQGNLKVTVAALRRALGDKVSETRYIANVRGRGYQFVAPVSVVESVAPTVDPSLTTFQNLPRPATGMVGRTETVPLLTDMVLARRFLTIVGLGGVGKTTVAIAVAQFLSDRRGHGVCFVDMAGLSDPHLVASAVAERLGLDLWPDAGDHTPAIAAALSHTQLLLVLDGCDRVLESAAAFVEHLLPAAPGVRVLATSREPLRGFGEAIHRLPPLAVPAEGHPTSATNALEFPALELFVERARARLDTFALSDADVPALIGICRKLDGVALAIELAAMRVDMYTLRELSVLLDDPKRLLSMERRGALPRHRSLAAALDWSYDELGHAEQRMFRCVSVFGEKFSLAEASSVAGDDSSAMASIEALVVKSLVSADLAGPFVRYRLLGATRAYAMQKLRESGESIDVCRRHAMLDAAPSLPKG